MKGFLKGTILIEKVNIKVIRISYNKSSLCQPTGGYININIITY